MDEELNHNCATKDDASKELPQKHEPPNQTNQTATEIHAHEINADNSETRGFDLVFDSFGSFGHWQRVIFVLLCAADIFGAWAMFLPVFTGATPQWGCAELNGTTFPINDSKSAGDSPFGNLSKTCGTNETQCGVFIYGRDFTSIVTQWDLICSKTYVSDLITSVQASGLIVGAMVFGQLSDLIGRKISYFLAHGIISVAGFCSAFSPYWQVYGLFRFLVGVGFGGTMVVNCVYPLEFVGARWRTLCGTIGFWAVGSISMACIAYFIRDWRYLTATTSGIGFLYFVCWWLIPESPRWLLEQKRFTEAEHILRTIAKKNNSPMPDMGALKQYFVVLRKDNTVRRTYIDLMRWPVYRTRCFIVIMYWFTAFIIYYEISYNLRNLSGDRYLNLGLSGFVDLFAMISVCVFNNMIGRRRFGVALLLVTLACNVGLLGIEASGKAMIHGNVVRGIAFVGKSSALALTYVAAIYTAELFPTAIRNIGVGAGSMAARIGGTLAPQLVFLGTHFAVAPHIIAMILCLVTLPLFFLLPETNGKPLSDHMETTEELEAEPNGDVNMVTKHDDIN